MAEDMNVMNIGTILPPFLPVGSTAVKAFVPNLNPADSYSMARPTTASSTTLFSAFSALPPIGLSVGGYSGGAPASPEDAVFAAIALVIGALGTIGIIAVMHKASTVFGGWGNFVLGPLPIRAEEFRGTAAKASAGGEQKPLLEDRAGYNPERIGSFIFEFHDNMSLRAVNKMKAGLKHLEEGRRLRLNGGEDWQKSRKEFLSAITELNAAFVLFQRAGNRIQVVCCEFLAQAYREAGDYLKAEEHFKCAAKIIEAMLKNGEKKMSKDEISSGNLKPFFLYLSERSAQNWINAAYAADALGHYNSVLWLFSKAKAQLEKALKYADEIGEKELAGRLRMQSEALDREGDRLVENTLMRAMESEEAAREFDEGKEGDAERSEKLSPAWVELIDLPWISSEEVASRFVARFEDVRVERQGLQARLCSYRELCEDLKQERSLLGHAALKVISRMLESAGLRGFRRDAKVIDNEIETARLAAREIAQKLEADDSAKKESKYVADVILTAEEKHKSKGKAFENARDGAVLLITSNPDFAEELLDALMRQNAINPYLTWAIIGEVGAKHPELFTSELLSRFRDWAAFDRIAEKALAKL